MKYIDHVTPGSSTALEVLSTITGTNSLKTLVAVICDRTVKNTIKRSGVIQRLEEGLGKPLQWLVCFLHAIE